MSDTAASLLRKMNSADDLKSVVRTMKALAASSISQYEQAVRALDDYYYTVQLALSACFRQNQLSFATTAELKNDAEAQIAAVVFGSDQGLVGQFNEILVNYTAKTLAALPGKKTLWAVGERMESRLIEANLNPKQMFNVPNLISLVTPLVGQILQEIEIHREKTKVIEVYLFYNQAKTGAVYTSVHHRLLPPDQTWRHDITKQVWPSNNIPQVLGENQQTLSAFLREYLFVSLFRACVESLASENASRLAAMQRAEKNIAELLDDLNREYHRLRQNAIDEELFDVIAGFEALVYKK